jgi:hypothetical protein
MLARWNALQCPEGVQQWHQEVADSKAVKADLDVEATYLTAHKWESWPKYVKVALVEAADCVLGIRAAMVDVSPCWKRQEPSDGG